MACIDVEDPKAMSRDTNFYYSFLVLPPSKRRAVIAVWDFCRAVDDAVDLEMTQSEADTTQCVIELDGWRRELARCFDNRAPQTVQGVQLKPHIERFGLPRQPFDDLLDGVGMDLRSCRYQTFDNLYQYCLRVASTVGLICIEIFGCRSPFTRDYAVALGVALQLTNIIRDVPIDLKRDRVYLPTDDMRRFGCTDDDLRNGLSESVRALLAFECERARFFYSKAAAMLPVEDANRLVAAEIMGAIYLSILKRIEQREYDVFSKVVKVPRVHRAKIAASVWSRTMLRSLVRSASLNRTP
jgi:phytoene synthase